MLRGPERDQFAYEPALADSSGTVDDRQLRRARLDRLVEQAAEDRQLSLAPDHAGLEVACRARLHRALDPPRERMREDRRFLALQHQLDRLGELEQRSSRTECAVAYQHRAGLCRGLEARRDVASFAGDHRPICPDLGRCDHLAGVDADPHRELCCVPLFGLPG